MAKEMDCLVRRDLMNAVKVDAQRFLALGRECADEGMLSDAVDFLAKVQDEDGLLELKSRALADGDFFILTKINRALGRNSEPSELTELVDRALELGKATFAEKARAMIESDEKDGGS